AGIHVNGGGKVTMSGGSISGNTATGIAEDAGGGGVYVYNGSTFTMEGGTVSGNMAQNTQGNGAFVCPDCALNMSGKAQFAKDDDVYLYAYDNSTIPTITVAGSLTAASPVATITPSAYTAGRQVLSKGGSVTEITPDICAQFALTPNPDDPDAEWNIMPDSTYANGVLTTTNTVYLNASSGDDANSGLTASKAVKTLSKAIELFESQGAQKIMVCAAYTLPSDESTLLDRAGKEHLTLVRYDGSSDVSDCFLGTLLTISQGNVTITNVTLDGTLKSYNTDELLSISGSGTEVTLGDDAVICNNSDSGVFIAIGTFKMTGGTITRNTRYSGGGGVRISRGEFKMSGGIISGNNGGNYGGGVELSGYDVGKFTMSGGEISGNFASIGAGVYAYNGTFEMSAGTISGNQSYGTGDDAGGGGVYVSGKFTMSGGEITGNTAKSQGGGVFVQTGGTFTPGGTVSGNTPDEVYTAP
ncbi:MAG: hypothetical protein K2M50_11105, partial [Treponemataceae bacterium]|nr:hypothetical protein [Treponemataceae bacterium]